MPQAAKENSMKSQSNPIVNTQYGALHGIIEKGLFVFKGIPYTPSMMGKNRWLPPVSAQPWKGVRPPIK
jgi:para-nitrobenzyl esterase